MVTATFLALSSVFRFFRFTSRRGGRSVLTRYVIRRVATCLSILPQVCRRSGVFRSATV